jgi:hypothetical protein
MLGTEPRALSYTRQALWHQAVSPAPAHFWTGFLLLKSLLHILDITFLSVLSEKFCIFFLLGGGETGSHYLAQVGPELTILLPQSPKGWDFRCAPPWPAQRHYP